MTDKQSELRKKIEEKIEEHIIPKQDIQDCADAILSLINQHTAEVSQLTDAERFELAWYQKQHETALEDYHEFGKAPVGSPERMAAHISRLSPWNLKNGADDLRDWRDQHTAEVEAGALDSFFDNVPAIYDAWVKYKGTSEKIMTCKEFCLNYIAQLADRGINE